MVIFLALQGLFADNTTMTNTPTSTSTSNSNRNSIPGTSATHSGVLGTYKITFNSWVIILTWTVLSVAITV